MGKILLKIVESYYFQSVSWRTLQIILSPIKWRNEKKWPKQNYFENTKIFSFFFGKILSHVLLFELFEILILLSNNFFQYLIFIKGNLWLLGEYNFEEIININSNALFLPLSKKLMNFMFEWGPSFKWG